MTKRNEIAIRTFLDAVAVHTRDFGFVSRSAAKDGGRPATADDVLNRLGAGWAPNPTEAEKTSVVEAIAWAAALPPEPEKRETVRFGPRGGTVRSIPTYNEKIAEIASAGRVDEKTAGFAASILISFERARTWTADREERDRREAEEETAARRSSKRFGTVGERVRGVRVRLDRTFVVSGHYGDSTVHKMTTADGDRLTWFASGAGMPIAGVDYLITATVKRHGEYRGVAETRVARVSWERLNLGETAETAEREMHRTEAEADREQTRRDEANKVLARAVLEGPAPIEFSESARGYEARERWARRYDELDGAPEGDWDR